MKYVNAIKMTTVAGMMLALLSGCDDGNAAAETEAPQAQMVAPAQEMTSALGGRLKIAIPDGFKKMTAETLKLKYPAGNAPSEAWATEDAAVSVAVSLTSQSLENDGQLEQVAQHMKKVMAAASPELSSARVNGHQTWTIKMTTPAADTSIVNLMQMSILDGRMLIVTFNATEAQYSGYEAKGKAALASVQF